MQLLLFLSALLSGLTGVIAGDRAVERSQIERLGETAAQQVMTIAQPQRLRHHAAFLAAIPALIRQTARPVAASVSAHALRIVGIDTRRIE